MRGVGRIFGVTLAIALVGCGNDAPLAVSKARPVKVAKLVSTEPAPPFRVTGVAAPYRQSEVSFEVSGRVTRIMDVGRSVQVVSREDPDGTWRNEREIIATIDDTTYRQQRDAAALRLATATAGIRAQEIDLNEVGPTTVTRAKAQRAAAQAEIESARATINGARSTKETAESDLRRNRGLRDERRLSAAEFDRYQNTFDTAVANLAKAQAGLSAAQEQVASLDASVAEAKAALRLKAENLTRSKAEIDELRNALAQAETMLERCILRAPFAGRITSTRASPGDFVAAGKPVLVLTLIDPIKVSVTVSADRERQILPGSHAYVRPRGIERQGNDGIFGTVFEKGAVADAATRTFRIDIMVRNVRQKLNTNLSDGTMRIGFRELLPAVERNTGEGGPLFVCKDCCVRIGDRNVVYRVRGAKFGAPRSSTMYDGKLPLDEVTVSLRNSSDADFMQILNWSFRAVDTPASDNALENGDLLVNFERLDPAKVKRGVVLERFEWAIRPGDLVPVSFSGKPAPRGLYVPDDAIRALNDRRSVFVVTGATVREVPITVHESIGRLHRIEGPNLSDGTTIVLHGVHYLSDGAQIVASEVVDLESLIRSAQ